MWCYRRLLKVLWTEKKTKKEIITQMTDVGERLLQQLMKRNLDYGVIRKRKKRAESHKNFAHADDDTAEKETPEESFSKWLALKNDGYGAARSRYYSNRSADWQAAMTYGYISARINKTLLEEAGHSKENFIASCEFNGFQCSPA
ncbi:hypothetical protein ElyMa_000529200 [Elysia marginata]|uniref:Uncharacterized protein n=1 Tax=Elysia marginata TaxID=1093978 RepID=A0AAV4FY39_9GAST|nr:hypothetical protein ElyMa_000529200 [Elysia marginata]